MNIKKILGKMGITNVQELDFRVKEDLVKAISNKISDKFSDQGIEYSYVFLKLINTDMYLADIEKTTDKVCYIYKNQSIYFDREVDLSKVSREILKASLLRIQEIRNRFGKIQRLGLCSIDKINTQGLAINDASIEYLLYKLEGAKEEKTVAYGITLKSVSKTYPILTSIVRQMAFIVDENSLIKSALTGSNEFKKEFGKACSSVLYSKVIRNTDEIHSDKNNIIDLNNKILFARKIKEEKKREMRDRVEEYARRIQADYVFVQKELCTIYFDRQIENANSVEELENIKNRIKNYKKIIGISENPADNFFEKYSLEAYYNIEAKAESIVRRNSALTVQSKGLLATLFRKTRKLTQNSVENMNENTNEIDK